MNTEGRSTTFKDGTFTLAVNDEGDRGNYIVGTENSPAFVSIPELKSELASVSVKVVNGALGLTKTITTLSIIPNLLFIFLLKITERFIQISS